MFVLDLQTFSLHFQEGQKCLKCDISRLLEESQQHFIPFYDILYLLFLEKKEGKHLISSKAVAVCSFDFGLCCIRLPQ